VREKEVDALMVFVDDDGFQNAPPFKFSTDTSAGTVPKRVRCMVNKTGKANKFFLRHLN
jgi:hypothetical protein